MPKPDRVKWWIAQGIILALGIAGLVIGLVGSQGT